MEDNTEKHLSYVTRKKCPVCGSSRHETHIPFPDIPIVRCCSCSFIFSSRLMAADLLMDYYRKRFGSERHCQGQLINGKTNAWAVVRLIDTNSVRTFLDVGAGYGFLLKELNDRLGLQATGVELSEQEVEYGLTRLNVDLRNCLLSEADLKPASFDVVACFEVIEHVSEPSKFIDDLLEYLAPDGHLLLMTDNFESKVARDLGAGFPKWIPHSHVSHFSPATLERVLRDKGLAITGRMSYTPWELLARNLCYRIRAIHKTPEESFDLARVLDLEMRGTFRLFPLRRLINTIWAKVSARSDLEGALMYVAAKRPSV